MREPQTDWPTVFPTLEGFVMSTEAAKTVAVVGGGFTGAAVAYHLARSHSGARVLVFEPRSFLGGGVAYDTHDAAHRINVPSTKMSLVPGQDDHFARWIAETGAVADDPEASVPDGNLYPRRAVFGRYVAAQLAPFLAIGRVTHLQDSVIKISEKAGRWTVTTAAGREETADIVVLAATHPPPAIPAVLERALGADPRLIRDASKDGALDAIGPDARVLIVGTGLTMADVVASLASRGHTGKLTAVSRRGLLSRGHAIRPYDPFGLFTDRRHTALSLLTAIRLTITEAADNGLTWHSVIDAVRAQAQSFWPNLGVAEQRRLVRHLRPFWDVHRFRIAPQVEQILKERIQRRSLDVFAASLRGASVEQDRIKIELQRRRQTASEVLTVDAVVVTTGPAHDRVIATQPHLASLAGAGLIAPDAIGLGIACDRQGHALTSEGRPLASLFVAGPLARGTFGELMGLPQVSEYAQLIARQVDQALRARWTPHTPLQAIEA
jgi:uncharacterized NAD(P)/FAD-binding protein YdhS